MKLQPPYPNIVPDRAKRYYWQLNEDVTAVLSDGSRFFIPRGFRFDAHSVPRALWSVVPPFGLDLYAALVHDALLRLAFPRQYADREYRAFHYSPAYHVHPFRSWVMTRTVTFWGVTVSPMLKYLHGMAIRLRKR